MASHYETLGISNAAGPDEIKKAYRKLASQNHPDKGGDTAKFQEIEAAYRVLSDPIQKQKYDNPARSNFNTQDFDLNDIFAHFGFNRTGNPAEHFYPRKNKDIRVNIQVRLKDVLQDNKQILNIKTSNKQVNVDIVIPAGITSGTTIKYPNLGDDMFPVLPKGSLLVQVNVINDTEFEVNGLDIIKTLTITCFEAILGSEQTVIGLDGKQFTIQTPEGCQPDTKLKISGEGLPGFQKDIKGNFYIRIKITIPKNLSADQIELINKINTLTNQ
jgi:curved DNA-binding protein